MTEQPEALRIAAVLESGVINEGGLLFNAATESRRHRPCRKQSTQGVNKP